MNVDGIISKARAATGLTDLGDPTMLEGLEVLVKASNEEAQLSEAGVSRWEANLVKQLSNRLRVVDCQCRCGPKSSRNSAARNVTGCNGNDIVTQTCDFLFKLGFSAAPDREHRDNRSYADGHAKARK